jgi:gliding motility-associated-like protein
VLATSNEGDLSYSNTACVTMGARLFIPNSFTPNKDRLNDVFKPSISFVHNGNANANVRYEFSIYNRWGELVFHTNNPHDGWDGTFKGVQSEQDFYIYAITAVSYQDKIDLSRRGVFLLLH